MKTKIVVFVFFTFLCAGIAFGAPSITSLSGTFSDDETVVISGTGFGTKSPASPLLWDTFEDGADASADIGTWGNFSNMSTETSTVRRGTNSARARDGNAGSNMGLGISFANDTDYIFASFWRRYNYVVVITPGDQHKLWEIIKAGGTRYAEVWSIPSTVYLDTVSELCESNKGTYGLTLPSINTWYREEHLAQGASGQDTSDGYIKFDRHSESGTKEAMRERSDVNFRCSAWPNAHEEMLISNYTIGTDSGDRLYYDDVYLDNTWARVAIGNNATFSSCDKVEMQIPTTWSDTSINITVNEGNQSGVMYLFVFDSNGDVSTGYQFTIGASVNKRKLQRAGGARISQ